jgi:hypothetical protein
VSEAEAINDGTLGDKIARQFSHTYYKLTTLQRNDLARFLDCHLANVNANAVAELARLRAQNAELLESLKDAAASGHASDCSAIQGPPGEQWTEDDKCNCFLLKARSAIRRAEEGK